MYNKDCVELETNVGKSQKQIDICGFSPLRANVKLSTLKKPWVELICRAEPIAPFVVNRDGDNVEPWSAFTDVSEILFSNLYQASKLLGGEHAWLLHTCISVAMAMMQA